MPKFFKKLNAVQEVYYEATDEKLELVVDDAVNCSNCRKNWQKCGYESYEDCMCQEHDECGLECSDCENNWQECGYESYEDCMCQEHGICPPECSDCANNWEACGYESYEDCMCQEHGQCYDRNMLSFTAKQANSTIGIDIPQGYDNTLTLYVSYDGQRTFESWDGSTITFPETYDTIYVYGENQYINYSSNTSNSVKFVMSGSIEADGSIDYLLHNGGISTSLPAFCYHRLFGGCTALIKAPSLPNTRLSEGCYYDMFFNCGLTAAPALPATGLATSCYASMFRDCSRLTSAPVLPATGMAVNCYNAMFAGCVNLETAPALPATSLSRADACYASMFAGCIKLTQAPALPAEYLSKQCYASMFQGCRLLTNPPALPSVRLNEGCYEYMFKGCVALFHSPKMPAPVVNEWAVNCYREMFYGCENLYTVDTNALVWYDTECANNWLYGVSPSGTFTMAIDVTIPTGASGIPSGWNVVRTSDNGYIEWCDYVYAQPAPDSEPGTETGYKVDTGVFPVSDTASAFRVIGELKSNIGDYIVGNGVVDDNNDYRVGNHWNENYYLFFDAHNQRVWKSVTHNANNQMDVTCYQYSLLGMTGIGISDNIANSRAVGSYATIQTNYTMKFEASRDGFLFNRLQIGQTTPIGNFITNIVYDGRAALLTHPHYQYYGIYDTKTGHFIFETVERYIFEGGWYN